MRTPPLVRLHNRLGDARRLLEIHAECTGNRPGRRHGYDALNRSAVVLSVAAWEGFVEDTVERAVASIARFSRGPDVLPKNVRDSMLAQMYEDYGFARLDEKTKEKIWSLAGRGWRREYILYARSKINELHTPSHKKIKKLSSSVIGLENFSQNWGANRWTETDYVNKLEEVLLLRHKIAHGNLENETVGKTKAKNAIALVERIAGWTDKSVTAYLRTLPLLRRKSLLKSNR